MQKGILIRNLYLEIVLFLTKLDQKYRHVKVQSPAIFVLYNLAKAPVAVLIREL